jgi:hypothetical protein
MRRCVLQIGRRHCEPTGRANARPMTGSAKQSTLPFRRSMDCFAALAMTTPFVMPGLDPGIHQSAQSFLKAMDCRA